MEIGLLLMTTSRMVKYLPQSGYHKRLMRQRDKERPPLRKRPMISNSFLPSKWIADSLEFCCLFSSLLMWKTVLLISRNSNFLSTLSLFSAPGPAPPVWPQEHTSHLRTFHGCWCTGGCRYRGCSGLYCHLCALVPLTLRNLLTWL